MANQTYLDPADASTLGFMAEALRSWDPRQADVDLVESLNDLYRRLRTPSGRAVAQEMLARRDFEVQVPTPAPKVSPMSTAIKAAAVGLLIWAGIEVLSRAVRESGPRRRTSAKR